MSTEPLSEMDEQANEPTRSELNASTGAVIVEFGSRSCGHCRAAQPLIAAALAAHPNVRRLKVEDGRGRRLGRSYGVKLWPTLVFLRDGREVARLVRPAGTPDIARALTAIDPAPAA